MKKAYRLDAVHLLKLTVLCYASLAVDGIVALRVPLSFTKQVSQSCPVLFEIFIHARCHPAQVGDLNACASQLDHGYTITDAEFYASNWSKWIRGMLGLDSSDSPRCATPRSFCWPHFHVREGR